VLPGEDARAYRRRLKDWMGSLSPRNALEQYLVERAVVVSWQLDRVDRAQIALLTQTANGDRPKHSTDDEFPAAWPWFDDSESGERLRRYQLGCGRALFQTLQTLSGFQQGGAVAGSGTGTTSTLTAPPSPGIDGRVAMVVASPAMEPSEQIGSPAAGILSDPMSVTSEVRSDEPSHSGPSRRHRLGNSRPRRPGWSATPGPGQAGTASADLKARPVRRARPEPESQETPSPSRRRVGGYAVPLDLSPTVSCADRIPVRLRRQASGLRQAHATCPSA
jgi:hypothetical protein